MWRYILIIALISAVVFVVLFVKTENSLDAKQIRYTNYAYEKYDKFRRAACNEFERRWNQQYPDNKIKVSYEPISTAVEIKFNTQIVANTLPDIVVVIRSSFYKYARAGVLMDLKPFIEKYDDREYINRIYPQLIDSGTIDGKLYALPINAQSDVLFYNRTLFDKANLSYPDDSWSWNELRDAAIKLTKRDASGRAVQFGLIWRFRAEDMALRNNAPVLNADKTRCVINSPEALEAVKFYSELMHKYKVTQSFAEEKGQSGVRAFSNNQAAMMIGARWRTVDLKELTDVDWAVAPLPFSFQGTRSSFIQGLSLGINAKTRYPDIAYQFLRFLTSEQENRNLVELGDSIPTRYAREANQYFINDRSRPEGENRAYLKSIEQGYTFRDFLPLNAPPQEVNQILAKYGELFVRGEVTAEQMLVELEQEINSVIENHEKPIQSASVSKFVKYFLLIIILPVTLIVLFWLRSKRKNKAKIQLTKKAGSRGHSRRSYSGYLFLIPNFVGFFIFILFPVLFSFILSFCDWDLLTWPPKFVGFANFTNLISDVENYWQYVFNTVFIMLIIPLAIIGSMALALTLNQNIRGRNIYRAVFFLPAFTMGIAMLMLWKWIFDTDFGLLNMIIARIGGVFGAESSGVDWLHGTPFAHFFSRHLKIGTAKLALMAMMLWAGIGSRNMLLYLAGLQGINPELYEAAAIDGAGGWQRFKNITWPLLSPTTFFIIIMAVIAGLQGGFQAAFIMTNGGPNQATTTISYGIYNNAFQYFNMGRAAAISWLLFLMVFVVTLINWRFGGKKVNY